MKLSRYLVATAFTLLMSISLYAQRDEINNSLDALLIQGDYNEVAAKCAEMLKNDSLNAEINYKLGLAYQNLMQTDKAINALSKAAKLSPDTKKYSFSLAKYYYNLGKFKLAQPMLVNLYSQDSTNWVNAYLLTDIYMQKGQYSKALPIYKQFYVSDTVNTAYIDKYAFCNLRLVNYDTAIILFEKSLKINNQSIATRKNLSYLYLKKGLVDTAIYQLNKGIEIDSSDYDLYNRRGDIYFSQNLHFKAGLDYQKVLSSGDSTKIVLKRMGIGLLYNQQNFEAIGYLKAAYKKDSSDFEIPSYLGQAYYYLKQYKNSINYYNKVIALLSTFSKQIDYTHVLIADSYKDSCLFNEAISHYTKSFNNKYTARICMTLAHLYDKELKNYDKAIYYYQLFLNNKDKSEFALIPDYLENVQKRLNWLIEQKKKGKPKVN